MMRRFVLGLAVLGLVAAERAEAGLVIDTYPSWDGSSDIGFFGEVATSTYGQTITAGADNVLDSFSFSLRDEVAPINFSSYVMKWDAATSRATGPVLYQSAKASTDPTISGFERFDFHTGGIALQTGFQYVLFLSVAGYEDFITDYGTMASPRANSYSGGQFVYTATDFTGGAWNTGFLGTGDVAFRAEFSAPATATPEPSTLVSAGIACAMGLGYGWRRRKARAA